MPRRKQLYTTEPTPQKWMRTADAARYIGVSPATLKEYRLNGRLPYYKLGNTQSATIIFAIRDLDNFVKQHKVY